MAIRQVHGEEEDSTDLFELDLGQAELKKDAKREKATSSSSASRLFAPTKSSLAKAQAKGRSGEVTTGHEKSRSVSERISLERRPAAHHSKFSSPSSSACASPHVSPPASPRAGTGRRRSDVSENLALRLSRQHQTGSRQQHDGKGTPVNSPPVSPRWSMMITEPRSPRSPRAVTGAKRQPLVQGAMANSQRCSTASKAGAGGSGGGGGGFGGGLGGRTKSADSADVSTNTRHRADHTREHASRVEAKAGRGGGGGGAVGARHSHGPSANSADNARSPRQDSRLENRFKARDVDSVGERERRTKKAERPVDSRAELDARSLTKVAQPSSPHPRASHHHTDGFESGREHQHMGTATAAECDGAMAVRREEGSPVSVLDAGLRRSSETDSEASSGELFADGSGKSVAFCYPDATVPQHHQPSQASPNLVANDLLTLSPQDIVGDVAGMEQDLEYVRHVLLISGFGGPALPPIFSRNLPINPIVFEQLEFEITGQLPSSLAGSSGATGSAATAAAAAAAAASRSPSPSLYPLPSFAVGAQNTSEERRQRMLLFDAVNEALGRTLAPYLEELQVQEAINRQSARPSQFLADTTVQSLWELDNGGSFFATCCSASRKPALLRPRPVGKQLLQRVWAEVHSWPVAPSEDVYDILDDAARRDMVRGTERWSVEEVAAAEVPQVVFALESAVLERVLEEICREFAEVEEQRAMSQQRRLSAAAAASEGSCAGKAPGAGMRKGIGSTNERRWLPRRLNF